MASKKTNHRESKTQVKNGAQNQKKEAGSPEIQQLCWRYTYTSLRKEKLMSTTPKNSKI